MLTDKQTKRNNRKMKRVAVAKARQNEKALDSKNVFGISDPTPKAALDNILYSLDERG